MARSFIAEIADPVSVFKKPNDFLLADDDGQFFFGHLWSRDHVCNAPVLLEGKPMEEAKRGGGNADRNYAQLLFVGQVDLIGTNLFRSQQRW
jgi:hypothetical protein